MDISITCTDLRYLYELENNSRFDDGLGLELREEGIFVNPPDDLAPAARGEMEELVRSRHPTGNLSEPVLKFPCTLRDLKKFTDWAGHAGCIDAFRMARFIKHKDWELAQVAAQELGQYHSPIIHKVFALRERIERDHAAEDNDAKKVVLREVLDGLNEIMSGDSKAPTFDSWPWGDYETEWLRLLARTAREWWSTYEPGVTPPKSKDVAAWLCKQTVNGKPVSPTNAKLIAQILRADGLPNRTT